MSRRLDFRLREIAFELNGEYEKSLDVYRSKNYSPSFEARALYRANRAAEAFDAYCRFADLTLAEYEEARDAANVPLTEALDKPRRVEDDYTFLSDVSRGR